MYSYVGWLSFVQQMFLDRCGVLGTEAVVAVDTTGQGSLFNNERQSCESVMSSVSQHQERRQEPSYLEWSHIVYYHSRSKLNQEYPVHSSLFSSPTSISHWKSKVGASGWWIQGFPREKNMEPKERGCVNKEIAQMVIEDKNHQDL